MEAFYFLQETVKVFTNKSYICDEPDKFGRTALMWAAIRDSVDSLKFLTSTYDATSFCDKNGYTGNFDLNINM